MPFINRRTELFANLPAGLLFKLLHSADPGLGIGRWIVQSVYHLESVRPAPLPAFLKMHVVAVYISILVQPRPAVEAGAVNNQRVAFPLADRIPQPSLIWILREAATVNPDFADAPLSLKKHDQPAGCTKELNGVGIEQKAWKTIGIAFHDRVVSECRRNRLFFRGETSSQPALEHALRPWCPARNAFFCCHPTISVCASVIRQPDTGEIVRIKLRIGARCGFFRQGRRLIHRGSILPTPDLAISVTRQQEENCYESQKYGAEASSHIDSSILRMILGLADNTSAD